MSAAQLPDPMVPEGVDLRGLEYMPLLGARLFASDFELEATDAEFRRGLRLWWAAWNQVPAGSLPASERAQAKLAGFEDETSPTWKRVKRRALDGFVLCSDGRLYHPVIAGQALIAWEKRQEDRDKRTNEAERQRQVRVQRKDLFARLRAVGIRPKYDTPMDELRRLVTEHVTPPVTVTGTPPVTTPVTPTVPVTVTQTDTAKTGRDETVIPNTLSKPAPSTSEGQGRGLSLSPGPDEPDGPSPTPSPAAAVCIALRRLGISRVNPAHPSLLMLLDAGATVDEFIGAADKAKDMRDPFAYLLATVEGQRRDAAAAAASIHNGPLPVAESKLERSRRELYATMSGGLASAPDPGQQSSPATTTDGVVDAISRAVAPRVA